MDYRKNHQNSFAASEVMPPDRVENIRNRCLNAGVAVPETIERIYSSEQEQCMLPAMRPEALRPKPKLEAAARKRFRGTISNWVSATDDSEQSPPQKGR